MRMNFQVGRGTAVKDGIAIAWAVAEELRQKRGRNAPMTIFATHYHELNELANVYDNVGSCNVKVIKLKDDKVLVTHEVVTGGSCESYGIEILKHSGFSARIVQRASQISRLLQHPTKQLGLYLRHAAECKIDTQQDDRVDQPHRFSDDEAIQEAFRNGHRQGYHEAKGDIASLLNRGWKDFTMSIDEIAPKTAHEEE